MNDLKDTWIYKRTGVKGLRVSCWIWFPLFYLFFGGVILFSLFMPEQDRVIFIVMAVLGIALLTKMFLGFRSGLKTIDAKE